jgi:NADH dehydrogenase
MPFPAELSRKATEALERLGVEVRTGVRVKDIDREGVTIAEGPTELHLDAKTVIWAGGVAASPLGRALAKSAGAETDKSGRIKVEPGLNLPRFRNIFVIGDLASSLDRSGKPLPGLAQVAMQGGAYAAKSILERIKTGQELPPFKYFDKGTLAVIGRAAAVANAFGVKLSGLPAWLIWAFIHLMYIVQFQSRVLVFIQWAIQDLTFSRSARLITGTTTTDFNFNNEIAAHRSEPGPKKAQFVETAR